MAYKNFAEQLHNIAYDFGNCRNDVNSLKIVAELLNIAINIIEHSNTHALANWEVNLYQCEPFCSSCKQTAPARNLTQYCPQCGAEMVNGGK